MKRRLLIVLLVIVASFCLAFGIAGCSGNESESSSSKWGDVFTIEAAYAQAEELGYTGTLDEFIAEISGTDGKDGVGIANVYIENGSLYVVLDDYTVINCGAVSTATACDHDYGEWQTAVEATCTSIGYDTRTCSLCGDVDYNFTTATGHSFSDEAEYEVYATTHTSFCSDCGLYVAEAHDFDDGGDCETCGLGLKYQLNSDGKSYTVTGAISQTALHAIIIPDEHNGYPVTAIQSDAFNGNTTITSVTIGNSVTSIESYAFYRCTSLTNITIGDSVTSIGEYAFYGCSSLISINIPDGVTSIESYAFYCCSSLTSINIPDSVTSIGSYAFYGCNSLTSITIGSGVTSIGECAFNNCTSLAGVYITDITAWLNISFDTYIWGDSMMGSLFGDSYANPLYYAGNLYLNGELVTKLILDEVTIINSYAFHGCTSLTSVTIGNGVTSIGYSAFDGCISLKSITIPDSVTYIDRYAFSGCSSLTSVSFENTEGWWCTIYSNATSGTSISSIALSNKSTAATYLTSDYCDCYWYRS